jgi:hypothetical protein
MDACRTAITETHPLSSRVWVPRNCNYCDAETVIGAALQGASEPPSRLSVEKWPCRVAEHRPRKKGLSKQILQRVDHFVLTAERVVTPIFCQAEDNARVRIASG